MNLRFNHHLGATLKRATMVLGASALVASSLLPAIASAAQITGRSVAVTSSSPAAANATTIYTFNFTVPTTGTAIKSFQAEACTNSIGACGAVTGFSATSSTVVTQPTNLGSATGWTVDAGTASKLRILNAANATNPSGAQTVVLNTVQNSTTANQTVYLRITTYSDAAWTTAIDTGTVAMSTTQLITVNADVAESLTFTTGVSGANCAAIAATGSSLTLSANPLSTGSVSTGTSLMCAATNATSGFNIQYLAGQFTNGTDDFANGYGVGGSASVPGTEEFGLKAALTSGSGGVVTAPYAGGTNYAFNPTVATNLASAAAPLTENIFTVTYSANVSNLTKPGSYSSVFNYICTGSF